MFLVDQIDVAKLTPVSLLLLQLLSLGCFLQAPAASAQAVPGAWSEPVAIAELDIDFGPSVAVAADQMGNVHVVWSNEDPTGSAFFYSRRSETGWTEPIDVLVSPDRALPRNLRLAVDSNGMLQLIWTGSRGYHASAPALEADSVHAWKQPRPFSSEQVISADIAVAPDGTLHILYAKTGENAYHVRSNNGGATWSEPQAVSDAVLAQTATNWPRIAAGSGNQIYAAWTCYGPNCLAAIWAVSSGINLGKLRDARLQTIRPSLIQMSLPVTPQYARYDP